MLTTSFTYSAVCLNTLFSTKWIYIVLKYKVQRLWFPLSFWWGQDLRDGSGNNRSGHFSLASLTGSEKSQMREWGKCDFKTMALIYKCNCLLVLVIGFNLLLCKKKKEKKGDWLECMLWMLTATDINSPVY